MSRRPSVSRVRENRTHGLKGSSGMNVGPCGEPGPGDPVWAKTGGPLTVV